MHANIRIEKKKFLTSLVLRDDMFRCTLCVLSYFMLPHFHLSHRYANRAKNIKNKPKINEDPKDALLRAYQEEIEKLKMMLIGKMPNELKHGNLSSTTIHYSLSASWYRLYFLESQTFSLIIESKKLLIFST